MTASRHLIALLKSHIDGDDEHFLSVAMQVAAHEARQGHGKLAQELRDLVDDARQRGKERSKKPVPLARPKGELASLAPIPREFTSELRETGALASHGVLLRQGRSESIYPLAIL